MIAQHPIALQLVLLMSLVGVFAGALPAAAHGGGEEAVGAKQDVLQAIAVIVSKPTDMETIEDKIGDALESDDKDGVDLALVEQAKDALEDNDVMKVRDLLQRSIGARPDLSGTDVEPLGEVSLVTQEETGTSVVTDELPGRGGLTGADVTLLVVFGVVALAGLALSVLFRPADTIRTLLRRASAAGR